MLTAMQHPAPFGSRLTPRTPPLCPEISLWLLGDDVDLNARVSDLLLADDTTAPYWAFCWGSGQALARFVLDHPQLVASRRVADLGTGSGVVAIAALLAGAGDVVAVDTDPLALAAAEANARLNAVTLRTQRALPEDTEVMLASDVLYEASNRAFILRTAEQTQLVVVSDPLRPGNVRLEQSPVAHYDSTTLPNVDTPLRGAAIYLLGREAETAALSL